MDKDKGFGEIDFVEHEKRDLRGYTLIEGFPGMGLVSTIATKYLIEKTGFKEFGYLDTNVFVPVIRIHAGKPVYPSRIYVNDKLKLVVLISEQIIPKIFADRLAKEVVAWVKRKGITRIISLEGIHSSGGSISKDKVYGIAANEKSKKILKEHGINLVQDGITTGVTALILLGLRNTNIDAVSILVNVNLTADYEASAVLLKKLNEMLDLKIDVVPLMKEAKETEKALIEQLQKMRKTSEQVGKLEDRTPMYT